MIVIVSGVTLALLAGCGSDKGGSGNSLPGGSSGGDKEPCSVLTDDQVKKAIGKAPKAHTPNTAIKPTVSCKWTTDEDGVSLDVTLYGKGSPVPPIDKEPWVPIDGLGDKSAFSDVGPVVYASAGGQGIQVLPGPALTDEEKNDRKARTAKQKEAGISAARDVLATLGLGSKGGDAPTKTTEPTSKTGSPETTITLKPPTKTTEPSETSETTETSEPDETTETTEP